MLRMTIAIAVSCAALAACKSDSTLSSSSVGSAPSSAIQETEPLSFRVDGMRRVNGAL
jgi:hypothetical protein